MGPKTLLRKFFEKRGQQVPLEKRGWLGRHMHDPELWHFGRRSVAGGVGLGLFLCFIPIPIQMVLAIPCAIVMRVNLPVTFTAVWATNPITFAPMFIFAFKVGSWITGYDSGVEGIPFEPTFQGVAATLDEIWYPLVVGCFICGISAAAVGSVLVRWLWRGYLVTLRRRRLAEARRSRSR